MADEGIRAVFRDATHPLAAQTSDPRFAVRRTADNHVRATVIDDDGRQGLLRGCLRTLSSVFYKSYGIDRARALVADGDNRWNLLVTRPRGVEPVTLPMVTRVPALSRRAHAGTTRKRKRNAAIALGQTIDDELSQWCANARSLTRMDAYTQQLLDAFAQWRWTPVCTQLPVYAARARVFTFIDLVVQDDRGNLIVVEIKTGYETYAAYGSGSLSAPLRGLSNAPLMQHALQALFGELALTHTFGVRVAESMVVAVTRAGTTRRPIDKRMRRRAPLIWDALIEAAERKRKGKTAKRQRWQ